MKRIIAVFLMIVLIFTFVACDSKNDAESNTETFEKPQSYATVLLITINPQFKVYLDDQDNVLAVEPVNADAKTVVKDTKFEGKLTNVIDTIVKKTNEAGFVKEDATLVLEIVETSKEITEAESILTTAKDTAGQAFKEANVTVQINTSISQNATSNPSSQESSSDNTSSNNESSEPSHTHSFAAATCTAPKTCSCGVTEGSALGHSFKDGKCTVCGVADPDHKLTDIAKKNGDWKAEYVYNEKYYSLRITLSGDNISAGIGIGDPLSKMEQEIQDDIRANKNEEGYKESYIVFEGKEYWSGRGSFTPVLPPVVSGNTITITSSDESAAQIVLTRTGENTLTVKSCTQTFKDMLDDIPAGTKLTFKAK